MVERKRSQEEIDVQDLQRITNFWNPRLSLHRLGERFEAGATLWLIRSEGELAGFGWTLVGRTMGPHYLPLGANDVHLFDFLIYPEHRGKGINPKVVTHILNQLAQEGRARAYIEATEWNHPQLTSLNKTAFHYLGRARKISMFGRTIVEWKADEAARDQKR